jgi:subtilisin family serine protease
MDPLVQTRLRSLMDISSGDPNLTIGIIDGPVDLTHPAFQASKIKTVRESQVKACNNASSIACSHGTFIAGILFASRQYPASAICPDCEFILNPIFKENADDSINKDIFFPSATAEELSTAIVETVDAGAKIINLSLGLSASSLTTYDTLQQAYDYSLKKGVILVVAAGNQGCIGNVSLINHQWVIPVAACNENGGLDFTSNYGPSIGNRGVMAPGANIRSTSPGGRYTTMSGTSFAAAFVTATLALLWSVFPTTSAAQLIYCLRVGSSKGHHRSITPSLLNVETTYHLLETLIKYNWYN